MPKPGLWHRMLAEAWRVKWELEDESNEMLRPERQEECAKPLHPELVKLIEMIEAAFREEQMIDRDYWYVKLRDWRNPKSRQEQMIDLFREVRR